MAILFNKPIKAQNGSRFSYTAVPSFNAGELPKKDDLMYQTLAGKVINQQKLDNAANPNNPVGGYRAVLNAEVPKEGDNVTQLPGFFNKGNVSQLSFLGAGDVKMGVDGRDTTFNLDDGLVHRVNIKANQTGAMPVSFSSTNGKKGNVNVMTYFLKKE